MLQFNDPATVPEDRVGIAELPRIFPVPPPIKLFLLLNTMTFEVPEEIEERSPYIKLQLPPNIEEALLVVEKMVFEVPPAMKLLSEANMVFQSPPDILEDKETAALDESEMLFPVPPPIKAALEDITLYPPPDITEHSPETVFWKPAEIEDLEHLTKLHSPETTDE